MGRGCQRCGMGRCGRSPVSSWGLEPLEARVVLSTTYYGWVGVDTLPGYVADYGKPDATGQIAFRWTAATGMVALGDLAGGDFYSASNAVTGYGCLLAGSGHSANGLEAFRWTEDIGIVPLGDLAGGIFQSHIDDASFDGSVLVGIGNDAMD